MFVAFVRETSLKSQCTWTFRSWTRLSRTRSIPVLFLTLSIGVSSIWTSLHHKKRSWQSWYITTRTNFNCLVGPLSRTPPFVGVFDLSLTPTALKEKSSTPSLSLKVHWTPLLTKSTWSLSWLQRYLDISSSAKTGSSSGLGPATNATRSSLTLSTLLPRCGGVVAFDASTCLTATESSPSNSVNTTPKRGTSSKNANAFQKWTKPWFLA